MDRKVSKYLSRYYHTAFGVRYECRESVRAQGRSLQTLHEAAVDYAKTLPEEERREAIKIFRRHYKRSVNFLKQTKKDVRESTRIVSKYQGKKLLLIDSHLVRRNKEATVKYRSGSRVWVKYSDGRESSLHPRSFKNIEIIEE